MKKISRLNILSAGFFGFLGVSLGAFGAHGLKSFLLEHGCLSTWETASTYMLLHAVAFLALVGIGKGLLSDGWIRFIAYSWLAGVFLFSGSLFVMCLSGITWLGAITPLGGTAFLLGWGALFAGAIKSRQ